MRPIYVLYLLTCGFLAACASAYVPHHLAESSVDRIRYFNRESSFVLPTDILENVEEMGKDASALLNGAEAAYFNALFKAEVNGFDLANMKVGFIYGGRKSDKKEYFDAGRRLYSNVTSTNSTLYLLDEETKEATGGYDAVICSWSKFLLTPRAIIKKMGVSSRLNKAL
jgi:hypothetical protein